ncbi:MAG TPA: hypothetical protein VLO30_01380 [Chthoniobacterales bacterium]|nr:hypothetical protein [Chthoniobacterales bacterium]
MTTGKTIPCKPPKFRRIGFHLTMISSPHSWHPHSGELHGDRDREKQHDRNRTGGSYDVGSNDRLEAREYQYSWSD